MVVSHEKDHAMQLEDVSKVLIAVQRGLPNSYRLMKSPSTRSCMRSVFEKQIVRRTNRLIRVRRLMCLLSIFCVCAFPTVCCAASRCRSYAPPAVGEIARDTKRLQQRLE